MKVKFLLTAFMALFATGAFCQELDFEITNDTGVDLLYIHVSPSDEDHWGEDIIPGDVFENGATFEVFLPVYDESICSHDIKVTDYEGYAVTIRGVDLCGIYSIVLYFDGDQIMYSAE
ncbi:MAG: hypothetical protein ACI9YL_001688 [Luteibaculaceae bacterium]|jgi:hypothetical protein